MFYALLLLPMLLLSAMADVIIGPVGPVVGSYHNATVGVNETALLTTALANDTLYKETVTTRLCFTEITALQEQVVAGINYKYNVTACEVKSGNLGQGKCSSTILSSCTPHKYVITVYEEVWTNTTQVSSIHSVNSTTTDGGSPTGGGTGKVGGSPTGGAANVAVSVLASAVVVLLSVLL